MGRSPIFCLHSVLQVSKKQNITGRRTCEANHYKSYKDVCVNLSANEVSASRAPMSTLLSVEERSVTSVWTRRKNQKQRKTEGKLFNFVPMNSIILVIKVLRVKSQY